MASAAPSTTASVDQLVPTEKTEQKNESLPRKLDVDPASTRSIVQKLREKWAYIRTVITLEPVLGAYLFAMILPSTALDTLDLYKACASDLGFNDTVCDAIATATFKEMNFTAQNQQVHEVITTVKAWIPAAQQFVPILIILFLGSYSDRHKMRKPFILIPLFGDFLGLFGAFISIIYMREISLGVYAVLQLVVPSLLGSTMMIIVASFSYISDVSTEEMRTLRIGILQLVMNICIPIARYIGVELYSLLGYLGTVSVAIAIFILNLLYCYFFIKEPRREENATSSKKCCDPAVLADVFNPTSAFETFALLLKRKLGNNRFLLVMLMLIIAIGKSAYVLESDLFGLYAQQKFSWSPTTKNIFDTIGEVVKILGLAIAIPLLTKIFKLSDYVIILITFGELIVTDILYFSATVSTEFLLYIGLLVGAFGGMANIGLRSLTTKVVCEEDVGKAQAIFSICESLALSGFAPLYFSVVYLNTLKTFPEAFLLLSIGCFIICCILLGIIIVIRHRKSKKLAPKEIPEKPVQDTDDSIIQSTYL